MFPGKQIMGELLVYELLPQEKLDKLTPKVLGHPLETPVRQVIERSLTVESAFKDQKRPPCLFKTRILAVE